MRWESLAVLAALALGVPGSASAQGSAHQARHGLWGGFGFGTAVNLTDTYAAVSASAGSLWGFGGYGRIGGTLDQRLVLGGETYAWGGSRDGVDFARGNVSAVILFIPSPQGGVFLKGGVGFGYVATAIFSSRTVGGIYYQNSVTQGKSGFGATAGVGFEVRIGRNVYLVPEVDWYLQSVGSQTSLVFGETPGTNNLIAFSLGLTWH